MVLDNNGDGASPQTEPSNSHINGETGAPTKQQMRVSYEEYKRLAELFINHLRKEEKKSETGKYIQCCSPLWCHCKTSISYVSMRCADT